MKLRRLWIAAAALALVLAVTGCATSSYSTQHHAGGQLSGLDVADSNNNGSYVQAGGITYQLQISRQLNPYGTEDSQYIRGLPSGFAQPTSQQLWYGVFLWAKNQWHRPYKTTDNFVIQDTQGNKYTPVTLNPAENPFAWTAQWLAPGQIEPGQDTAPSQVFSRGRLVLFKLNQSIYDNRPLTFYILSSSGKRLASISLDL